MKRKLLFKLGALFLSFVAFTAQAQLNESFNTTALPGGWTNTSSTGATTGNAIWKFTGNPGYNMSGTTDHTGNGGSFAWVDGSTPYPITVTLTSPAVTPVAVPYLDFYLKRDHGSPITYPDWNTVTVDYFDGATWHNAVFTHSQNTTNGDWELFTVDLSSYPNAGGNVQFRINVAKFNGSASFYDDVALDDISFYNNAPCVAPPTAGMVVASDTGVCANQSFSLTTFGATAGSGITYQWQSSPDNLTWTDIAGATSVSYSTSQTADTYYRLIMTCSGQSDTTASFMQPMNPFYACYCNSGSTANTYGYIGEFQFANVSYTSPVGCQSYTNTGLTADVLQGSNYSLSAFINSCTGTTAYNCYVKVWIDFNQNGSYTDPGEEVYSVGGTYFQTFNGNIAIPATAPTGVTGMRISMQESGSASLAPCSSYTWGEVEDYMINVLTPPANDAGIAAIDTPYSPVCVTPNALWVRMSTMGTDSLTSATINWSVNGVAQTPVSWTGGVAPISTDTVPSFVGNYPFLPGDVISVWTSMPNGVMDSLSINDTVNYTVLPVSMNGNYTIDPLGVGANNFVDFASALNVLNASGVCGPVVFEVADGTYNEQLNFGNILGASSVNTVTFNSASGDTALCKIEYASASGEGVINLNSGSSYLKFNNLAVENITTSSSNFVVDFLGDVEGVEFSTCRLTVNGTSSPSAVVHKDGPNAVDCKFVNNTLLNGYYGFQWEGTSSNRDQNTELVGNEIFEQYYYGTFIYYQDGITISDNKVKSDAGYSYGYGIRLYYSIGDVSVTNNHVYQEGSSNYPRYGMYIYDVAANPNNHALVQGNAISLMNTATYGVYLSNVYFTDILNNSVIATGTSYSMYVNGGYNTLYNNALQAIGTNNALYTTGTTITESDNNAFLGASNYVYWGSAQANLAALQASTGMNMNSVEVTSIFTDSVNLFVCNDTLDGAGTSNPSYVSDIQGDPVDQSGVDIGADQFATPASFDVADISFCPNDTATIEVFYFDSVVWNLGQHIGPTFDVYDDVVVYVDGYGICGVAHDTVAVTEAAPVNLPATSSICYMDTLSISTNIANAQSYAWSNGATTPTVELTSEGTYTVTVVDEFGCSSNATTVATFSTPVTLADTTPLCESVGAAFVDANIAGTYDWSTGDVSQSITVTSEGTYGVTVTDNDGCVTSSETEVVSTPDPVASYSAYILYYNVQFTNTGTGDSYYWDFGDGSNSTDVNPSHTYNWTNDSIVYYTVTMVAINDCGTDTATFEVGVGDGASNGPLGTNEISKVSSVNVYPNPSNGVFDVSFVNIDNKEVTVQVYDIQGKEVIARNYGVVIGDQKENLSIENVSSGIYFMNVQIGDETQVVKLIVH